MARTPMAGWLEDGVVGVDFTRGGGEPRDSGAPEASTGGHRQGPARDDNSRRRFKACVAHAPGFRRWAGGRRGRDLPPRREEQQ